MINSIALNIVVYNEAHRIADTLDAARPYVDFIVIVDQKSTDGTIDVICEWNQTQNDKDIYIYEDRHWGYCEPSRVKAWEQSAGADWILALDADEQITDEFANEMRFLNEMSSHEDRYFRGCRLKRSLWVSGEHKFTGDYQYRFFDRNHVKFLDELHTEPQPYKMYNEHIYYPEYVGIVHTKTWTEQIRDEQAYTQVVQETSDPHADRKLSLNVYSEILRKAGATAEEADSMSPEERHERGII